MTDGDLPAAARELTRLLRTGEMICNGDGQVLHYLVGLWLRSAALRGIERLATHDSVTDEVRAELMADIDRAMIGPDGLAQSLRVDFCSISLPQLDRALEHESLEAVGRSAP